MAFKHILILLFCVLAITGINSKAHACLGIMLETQTFLTELPENAKEKEVVGKVVIIGIDEEQLYYKTMVTEAIKGLEDKQIVTIPHIPTSCSRDYDLDVGDEYYIAGKMDEDGLFQGQWQGLPTEPYWKQAPVETIEQPVITDE